MCEQPAPRRVESVEHLVEIVGLLASPIHRYEGRPKDGPVPYDGPESVAEVSVRAQLGIVGDRFFNQRAHRHESITIMAIESLEEIGLDNWPATRRNIILRGFPVDELLTKTFSLGGLLLQANSAANPCAWMDEQLAPGAFRGLRKRGGLRCEPLTDGTLRTGKTTLVVEH